MRWALQPDPGRPRRSSDYPSSPCWRVSGAPHYGVLASSVIAVVVAAITCVVSWVVAAFAFATALSGSVTGLVLAPVLFGAPALSVLILGLPALRVVPGRAEGVSIHREAQYQ